MMSRSWQTVVGVDVGGANLKYALASPAASTAAFTSAGQRPASPPPSAVAWSSFFPMWMRHESLASQLVDDLRRPNSQWSPAPRSIDALAVTMTGELADCFVDRAEGVLHIVRHCRDAADQLGIEQVLFYGVDGKFHAADACEQVVDVLAAANWHALGSFVAQTLCPDGTLIDVGSTTTDIIPIKNGEVATAATTDHERLAEGSLVYLGGSRTPVAGLVDRLVHQGRTVPVMNEWFATMDDVRIVLGQTPQAPQDHQSADGKPRSSEFAANRLARMIGLDRRHVSLQQAAQLATQVHRAARDRISEAIERVRHQSGNPNVFVLSGHANDLIELPAGSSLTRVSDHLGEAAARSAPAVAVAQRLLAERSGLLESCGG